MKQVTTLLGELLKIFPRYEFEKLEKQHQQPLHEVLHGLATADNLVLCADWRT